MESICKFLPLLFSFSFLHLIVAGLVALQGVVNSAIIEQGTAYSQFVPKFWVLQLLTQLKNVVNCNVRFFLSE